MKQSRFFLIFLLSQFCWAAREQLVLNLLSYTQFNRGAVIQDKYPGSPTEPGNTQHNHGEWPANNALISSAVSGVAAPHSYCEYLYYHGPNPNPNKTFDSIAFGMNYMAHVMSLSIANISNIDQTIEINILPGSYSWSIHTAQDGLVNTPTSTTLAQTIKIPPKTGAGFSLRNFCDFGPSDSNGIVCQLAVMGGDLSIIKSFGTTKVNPGRHWSSNMHAGLFVNLGLKVLEDRGAVTATIQFYPDYRPSNVFNCVIDSKVMGVSSLMINSGKPF